MGWKQQVGCLGNEITLIQMTQNEISIEIRDLFMDRSLKGLSLCISYNFMSPWLLNIKFKVYEEFSYET